MATAEYQREWYIAHQDSERAKARVRARRRRAAGATAADKRRHYARHPERVRARNTVWQALKDGHLDREPCEVCGTTEDVQAHHEDYSCPLDVRWLCRAHHWVEHVSKAC